LAGSGFPQKACLRGVAVETLLQIAEGGHREREQVIGGPDD
jgi:hypothetical protein